jgi:homoserine dehydrogenase
MTQIVKTAMIGCGNVGQNFLRILEMKEERLREQYDLAFRIVAVADSSGVAVDAQGFDPVELRRHKETDGRVSQLTGYQPGQTAVEIIETSDLDLVLEASPVNLDDGEPGLSITRAALAQGTDVVLANKAPLVLAFDQLHELAHQHDAGIAFSATVCGALPVINIGRRDMVAADIVSLRGIFNSTSNFILGEMATGRSFAEALAEAQRRGIAEADPSLDVEGWDTANKLVIIANSFLGVSVTLEQVNVTGIPSITTEKLQNEMAAGNTIKLVATASRTAEGYKLSVGPTVLPFDSFLGRCNGWEMGIEMQSDIYGRMYHKIWEREPLPTAAAMLRDAVNFKRGETR